MRETTLCYLQKDNNYLMLYRNVKKKDGSLGKWQGVGGKLEPGETPDECAVREVREETGLTMTEFVNRGTVYFYSDTWEDEIMYLYTCTAWTGEMLDTCDEGQLEWIPLDEVLNLNLWEGDPHFLRKLIAGESDIEMDMHYEGHTLASWSDHNA